MSGIRCVTQTLFLTILIKIKPKEENVFISVLVFVHGSVVVVVVVVSGGSGGGGGSGGNGAGDGARDRLTVCLRGHCCVNNFSFVIWWANRPGCGSSRSLIGKAWSRRSGRRVMQHIIWID